MTIKRVVMLVELDDGTTQLTQIAGADTLVMQRLKPRLFRRLPRLRFTLVNPGPTGTFDPTLAVAPLPPRAGDWERHINDVTQFNRTAA